MLIYLEFLKQNPKILLDNLDIWDKVLAVKEFFKNNPKPNIYIIELPIIGVDTKFIQTHKKIIDKVLMQVCEYDKNITSLVNYGFEKKYFLKYPKDRIRIKNKEWNDIEINIDDLKKFSEKKLFIIENLQTYLAFPKALQHTLLLFESSLFFVKLYFQVFGLTLPMPRFSLLSFLSSHLRVLISL